MYMYMIRYIDTYMYIVISPLTVQYPLRRCAWIRARRACGMATKLI